MDIDGHGRCSRTIVFSNLEFRGDFERDERGLFEKLERIWRDLMNISARGIDCEESRWDVEQLNRTGRFIGKVFFLLIEFIWSLFEEFDLSKAYEKILGETDWEVCLKNLNADLSKENIIGERDGWLLRSLRVVEEFVWIYRKTCEKLLGEMDCWTRSISKNLN